MKHVSMWNQLENIYYSKLFIRRIKSNNWIITMKTYGESNQILQILMNLNLENWDLLGLNGWIELIDEFPHTMMTELKLKGGKSKLESWIQFFFLEAWENLEEDELGWNLVIWDTKKVWVQFGIEM